MAQDAIQRLTEMISNLEWATRQVLIENTLEARSYLLSLLKSKLKTRSGALAASVRTATTRVTSGGSIITAELQLNPGPGNPKGYHAVEYAGTQMGTGVATINSRGKRMAIPIPKGPAYSGAVALYMPSTYPGAIAGFSQSSVLYAVRTLQKTRKLGRGQNLMDLVPTWLLKDQVKVPRRVDPQIAANKVKKRLMTDLRNLLGRRGVGG